MPDRIRCPNHLSFIRGFECCIAGRGPGVPPIAGKWKIVGKPHECEGRIEAAHVRLGTDGGTSVKPSDCYTVPLCSKAHREQHYIGERDFEARYGIDMKKIATGLWQKSPHRLRYEQKRRETDA